MKADRLFIVFGVLAALAGMGVGEHMGQSGDPSLRPAHVHLLALGWLGGFIFGLCYRAWPDMKADMAMIHFILHALGVTGMFTLLMLTFSGKMDISASGPFLGLAGYLVIAGILLFAFNFLTSKPKNTAS